MTKGRNTSPITVRVPDDFLVKFKAEAEKRGKPYTVLIRELMYKGIGLNVPTEKTNGQFQKPKQGIKKKKRK